MTDFWKALAKRQDGLARRIFDFNVYPARLAHPSYFPEFADKPAVLEALRGHPAACRRLSEGLLQRLEPRPEPCWDFADARRRLALMTPDSLLRLLLHAGATLLSTQISHEIGHDRIHEFVASHGEALHQFALKRAPILVASLPKLPPLPAVESLARSVEASGRFVLELCFRGQPRGLRQLSALRLPADWPWEWERPAAPDAIDAAWVWLRRLAVHETNPEFAPCFA